MKVVLDIGREINDEKTFSKWLLERGRNEYSIIERAFFTGTEKTPANIKWQLYIAFQDGAEYIELIEIKLKDELFIFDLKHFVSWQLGKVHWIGYWNAEAGISFEGNILCQKGTGLDKINRKKSQHNDQFGKERTTAMNMVI